MILGPLRIIALAFGVFLIIDAILLHLLIFAYTKIGLGFVDYYFSHFIWGVLLIGAALFAPAGRRIR